MEASVKYDTINVQMPDIDRRLVRRWIIEVARRHGFTVGGLNYRFCDDAAILECNNQYLGHDYYTDIITFDYTQGNVISGDIIISLDTVRSNAEAVNASYDDELHRVIIHGVLHLCGINDKGPGEREIMELHENDALKLLRKLSIGDNSNLWV